MAVLALDLATTTGWAYWFQGQSAPTSGAVKFAGEIGDFALRLDQWLDGMMSTGRVTALYIEAPVIARKTNLATTMRLIGSQVIAHKVSAYRKVPCVAVSVSEWRKYFLGRTKAPASVVGQYKRRKWLKEAAVKECVRRGWVPSSDDEADALGLLAYIISGKAMRCGAGNECRR